MNEVKIQFDRMSDIKKIDFKTIQGIMKKDLEEKYKSYSLKDKEKLIRKYIEKISIQRLDDSKYNIKFGLNLVLEEDLSNEVIVDNTYIKN